MKEEGWVDGEKGHSQQHPHTPQPQPTNVCVRRCRRPSAVDNETDDNDDGDVENESMKVTCRTTKLDVCT